MQSYARCQRGRRQRSIVSSTDDSPSGPAFPLTLPFPVSSCLIRFQKSLHMSTHIRVQTEEKRACCGYFFNFFFINKCITAKGMKVDC